MNCRAYSITLWANTYNFPKTATFRVSGFFWKFKRNKMNLFPVCCSFKSHRKRQFKMLPWSASGAGNYLFISRWENNCWSIWESLKNCSFKGMAQEKVYQYSELNTESEKASLFSKLNKACVALKFHWTPLTRFMACANASLFFFFFAWKNRTGTELLKKIIWKMQFLTQRVYTSAHGKAGNRWEARENWTAW